MDQRQTAQITYDEPPLVEVAISVQFDPPKGLHQGHLGAFWASQRHRFPDVRATQQIASTAEVFGNEGQWIPPSLHLALTNEPDCRLQLTSSDGQWMCQVQRDRLVVNWRKRLDEYPRFNATWKRFREIWLDWDGFLINLGIPSLLPRMWDLTYVNRVPKTSIWKSPSDWAKIFPGLWKEFPVVDEASLAGFQGKWVWEYPRPAPPAKLYVECRPGRSSEHPASDVLFMTLTARGPVELEVGGFKIDQYHRLEAIEQGINCGHKIIVTTFDQLASANAKEAWKRHEHHD